MSISHGAPPPAKKRRKRSPEEAQDEALTAARLLLLEKGPNAVTLAAVGKAVGMTHANVIHHFGSAAGLQSALMGSMVRDLTLALDVAVAHVRSDAAAPRQLIDIVFDAFEKGGAGRLAAWIALSGDLSRLDPVQQAMDDLVQAIKDKLGENSEAAHKRISSSVLLIATMAFGDALIGGPLRGLLGREDDAGRKVTAQLLPSFFPGQK
ncbi:MAG: TetR/AcrR family transcriptional regulator [Pseudomonadota bacterium]